MSRMKWCLALGGLLGLGWLLAPAAVDVQPRPLERIAPGTVIGEGAPKGWSHLVMFVKPRIGQGDVDAVPKMAVNFASMFMLTILANVNGERGPNSQPSYALDKVALGFALNVKNQNVIATSKQTFGANLGFIGQSVFEENEKCLNDVLQVARTRTMLVFDAKAIMLRNNQHQYMVIRHVVLIAPADGRLTTFAWLLAPDRNGTCTLAEDTLQILPASMKEDRVMNVKREKFTLGIPSQDAFAMVRIPQGMPVRYTPELQRLAAEKPLTSQTTERLEAELQRIVQQLRAHP